MVYVPSSFVVPSRDSPVATFVAVTFASLTTAPFGSVMVPVIVPLLLWAAAVSANASAQKRAAGTVERLKVLFCVLISEPRMVKGFLDETIRFDLLDWSRRAGTAETLTSLWSAQLRPGLKLLELLENGLRDSGLLPARTKCI